MMLGKEEGEGEGREGEGGEEGEGCEREDEVRGRMR